MTKHKRAALYVRVSTDAQTVENQIHALGHVAEAGRSSRSTAMQESAAPRDATSGQAWTPC